MKLLSKVALAVGGGALLIYVLSRKRIVQAQAQSTEVPYGGLVNVPLPLLQYSALPRASLLPKVPRYAMAPAGSRMASLLPVQAPPPPPPPSSANVRAFAYPNWAPQVVSWMQTSLCDVGARSISIEEFMKLYVSVGSPGNPYESVALQQAFQKACIPAEG